MMPEALYAFLGKEKVANLCVVDKNNLPYCFSCYYAFDEGTGFLIFKTSPQSYHGRVMQSNFAVAGTVLPEKTSKLFVQGIQLGGNVIQPTAEELKQAKSKYYDRFPFARAMSGEIVIIALSFLKMTDSSKGLGKKKEWRKPAATPICEN